MALHRHDNVQQRDPEWYALRCGILTASVIGKLVTAKKLEPANNETSRDLTASLVAEQVTGHVDPTYQTADMLRGVLDEPLAREAYAKHTGCPVEEVGFMTRDDWGFPIGYSPDGLVGDLGLIEIKSRKQKEQVKTVLADEIDHMVMAQIQCGLLVSGRAWCDFISFSSGMELWVKRVHADNRWHLALLRAAGVFHEEQQRQADLYRSQVDGLPLTERIDHDLELTF